MEAGKKSPARLVKKQFSTCAQTLKVEPSTCSDATLQE